MISSDGERIFLDVYKILHVGLCAVRRARLPPVVTTVNVVVQWGTDWRRAPQKPCKKLICAFEGVVRGAAEETELG